MNRHSWTAQKFLPEGCVGHFRRPELTSWQHIHVRAGWQGGGYCVCYLHFLVIWQMKVTGLLILGGLWVFRCRACHRNSFCYLTIGYVGATNHHSSRPPRLLELQSPLQSPLILLTTCLKLWDNLTMLPHVPENQLSPQGVDNPCPSKTHDQAQGKMT